MGGRATMIEEYAPVASSSEETASALSHSVSVRQGLSTLAEDHADEIFSCVYVVGAIAKKYPPIKKADQMLFPPSQLIRIIQIAVAHTLFDMVDLRIGLVYLLRLANCTPKPYITSFGWPSVFYVLCAIAHKWSRDEPYDNRSMLQPFGGKNLVCFNRMERRLLCDFDLKLFVEETDIETVTEMQRHITETSHLHTGKPFKVGFV